MEENKYKDVLKGIIEIIRNAEHSDIGFASICTYLDDHCPELKSEDERIREELIEHIKANEEVDFILFQKFSPEQIIAYLEKVKDFDEQLEQAYKNSDEVQYKRGYDDGYVEGMVAAKKKKLEKQGEFPATISVDKMVDEFENFKVISCGRIPSFMEIDAYRKGVNDVLSKILIKEEKPITIGSKKAEGKLGEMIAASKKPAGSGDEDKQLSHKEVTKESEQFNEKDEKIRKKLIEYFKDLMGGWFPYSNEEIIAYLEKVKDFDKQLEVQYKRGYDAAMREITCTEREATAKTIRELQERINELTHSQVTKKSEQDGKKWIDEKVYWKEREELFEDGKQEVINNPAKYGLIKDRNHIANDSKKVESKVWSEEDEENYRNATTIISRQKLNAYTIEMMNNCSRCIDWLESIKERIN